MHIVIKRIKQYLATQKQLKYYTVISCLPVCNSNNVSTTTTPQTRELNSWTHLTSALCEGHLSPQEALHEASQIFSFGAKPNSYALTHLLRASTFQDSDLFGQQLHCHVLKSGFSSNVFVSTALISFYVKFESLDNAHQVFAEIPQPSVVSWNSLISGYVRSGKFGKALGLFIQLEKSGVCADSYSFTAALSAGRQLGLLKFGECVHGKIFKFGWESSVVVGNRLIDMYGKCGSVEQAVLVFSNMIDKDVISWNSVIAACARNQKLDKAFSFLDCMPDPDTISYNEVINGIAQFGNIEDAVRVLESMPRPNSSSWNSIITGYVNRERAWEALNFFSRMHSENVLMDQFTYSSILSGTAQIAAVTWGNVIHCRTVKCGLDTSVVVGSALIDMYSKCGQVKNAELMFYTLTKKNLVTWNAMISGYAHNGEFVKVIHLFEELKLAGDLKPDEITFLNILSGCSHNQMTLEDAMEYLELMVEDFNIKPTVEHCCAMIRIMGQRGQVEKAGKMIYEMGFASCRVVWRALLGASYACKNLKIAKIAAAKAMELEGYNDYVFVMMSHIHASYYKWEDVGVVRDLMRGKGLRKEAGYSWVEEENVVLNS